MGRIRRRKSTNQRNSKRKYNKSFKLKGKKSKRIYKKSRKHKSRRRRSRKLLYGGASLHAQREAGGVGRAAAVREECARNYLEDAGVGGNAQPAGWVAYHHRSQEDALSCAKPHFKEKYDVEYQEDKTNEDDSNENAMFEWYRQGWDKNTVERMLNRGLRAVRR